MQNQVLPSVSQTDPPKYSDVCFDTPITDKSQASSSRVAIQHQPQSFIVGQPVLITNQPQNFIIGQPVVITNQPVKSNWRHDICDIQCNPDCCYAYCCANWYLIELGMLHDENCCTMGFCGGLGMVALRTKIRTERNIEGTIGQDICAAICCKACALIQMKKETLENPVHRH